MSFTQRYRNSKILFGLSLLFLVGFLLVWLQYVYQDKVDELNTEVSYLWIKAIKDVESGDFSKLIITTFAKSSDSIHYNTGKQGLPSFSKKEILDNISDHQDIEKRYTFKSSSNQQTVKIILDSTASLEKTDLSHGLLFLDSTSANISIDARIDADVAPEQISTFANNLAHNIPRELQQVLKQFALDMDLVEAKLDSGLAKAKLPIEYSIISFQDSIPPNHSDDKFYTQTAVGSAYSLKLDQYGPYLLQKMWFEFLMALLLLVIIVSAFYYILNSLKEQHQLVSIKNDLISNITHELRTPIFTVSAALEALENFNGLEDPERTKEYLSISKNELHRLSILVEKVLKTSLFEQSAMQLNKETFEVNSLAQTIANSFKFQLENLNASLDIEASSENIRLHADKIHVTNVIYNLIDNALKYKADRPPRIRIHLEDSGDKVQITIQDNGIGIPKEYIGQIFNKFFRVPKGNQHNVKGYGLGLNYVSNIIQQHQGSIVAESDAGNGTSFKITLPKNIVS